MKKEGVVAMIRIKNNFKKNQSHQEKHVFLHECLDELFANFIIYGQGRTGNTILDLIKWSYKQTKKPDHPDKGDEL